MDEGTGEERKGWWGSTLGKLKTALSKTKSQIVGSVAGEEGEMEPQDAGGEQVQATPKGEQFTQTTETSAATRQSAGSGTAPSTSGSGAIAAARGTAASVTASGTASSGVDDSTASSGTSAVQSTADSGTYGTTVRSNTGDAQSSPAAVRTAITTSFPDTVKPQPPAASVETATGSTASAHTGTISASQPSPTPESTTVSVPTPSLAPQPAPAKVSTQVQPPVAAPIPRASQVIPVNEEYLDELEEKLIKADIGLANAESLVLHLRKQSRDKSWTIKEVIEFLRKEFLTILKSTPNQTLKYVPGKVNVYLIVGVNGTGKTTSIGKLCWRFKQEGRKVLMAAGDTFRAAAESQLEIWSQRAGVDIIRLEDGADPGAVVFKAMAKAKEENYNCLVIDTAGRLHNKANLMAELKKIRGVVEKHGSGLPLECLLVLDASTGQNGLQQAKLFTEVCSLTGVILTKLDGTAKGGVVFSIARDLKIPVKLIGLGEQIDDLRDFEPELFVEALF